MSTSFKSFRIFLFQLFILLVLALPTTALAADRPKSDIVIFENGDKLTCEIKGMSRGKLNIKPDGMGTIQVEWDRVVRLESGFWYLVQLKSGLLIYGQLPDPGQDHKLLVIFNEKVTPVLLSDVVEITPIRYNFFDKFSLSLSAGFNYTRSSEVIQYYADASTSYRGRLHSGSLKWNSMVTEVADDDPTRRHDLELQYQRLLSGKLWGYLTTRGESNEEMGLKSRTLGGAGLGYFLTKSNTTNFLFSGGLSATHEVSSTGEVSENSLEGNIAVEYSLFIFDSPETDLTIKVAGMPSITQQGRYRTEIDAQLKQEIFKDFFAKLKYFENYDSDPPEGANIKRDRGIVFSLGWSK